MKISYNWLKWYIDGEIPSPEKLAEKIIFGAFEVESVNKIGEGKDEDFILDIKTLPDRNHDCLSHQGMAREISGLLNLPFKDPTALYPVPESSSTNLKIKIETDKCRRYMARIVSNVTVGPSPEWVVKHLESIGQRSINNIVDATNLVMYDCGQPCHIFDLDKIENELPITNYQLSIKNAEGGEKIKLLGSENEIVLKSSDCVIANKNGNVLALAGVKGGKYAEVTNATKNIILEIANFDPISTRKTARRLSIFTDSAKRFENNLSPELCDFAMRELSGLLVEMCPEASFEEIVDEYIVKQEERKISFTADFVNKKLGTDISDEEIENILKRYSYSFTHSGGHFEVVVPALRLDLVNEYDMIEEIGRVYGYENIVPEIPKINFTPQINDTYAKIFSARKKMVEDGYSEVMTYSFAGSGAVEVLESASDKKFLRENLSDGLKKSYELNKKNAPLLGLDEIKIFEIGTVFLEDKEELHIAYADKKGITETTIDEYIKNYQLTMNNYQLETTNYKLPTTNFSPWSSFPFITRDISGWVNSSTSYVDIAEKIKIISGPLLVREPRLVDRFEKDGRTSYAFRLVFQAFDRTLTDEEVNKIMDSVALELSREHGFEIR